MAVVRAAARREAAESKSGHPPLRMERLRRPRKTARTRRLPLRNRRLANARRNSLRSKSTLELPRRTQHQQQSAPGESGYLAGKITSVPDSSSYFPLYHSMCSPVPDERSDSRKCQETANQRAADRLPGVPSVGRASSFAQAVKSAAGVQGVLRLGLSRMQPHALSDEIRAWESEGYRGRRMQSARSVCGKRVSVERPLRENHLEALLRGLACPRQGRRRKSAQRKREVLGVESRSLRA